MTVHEVRVYMFQIKKQTFSLCKEHTFQEKKICIPFPACRMSNMYRSRGMFKQQYLKSTLSWLLSVCYASATALSTQKYLRKTPAISLRKLKAWSKKVSTTSTIIYISTTSFLQFYLCMRVDCDCWLFSSLLSVFCFKVWTVPAFKLLTANEQWFSRCRSPFL